MNTSSLPSTHISNATERPYLDARALRSALGRFTTGVTVITACGPDGRQVGVTANSFNSVSLDPPLVLWSLARRSGSLPVFQAASHWAVHVLAHNQADVSAHFAKSSDDKFAGLECGHSAEGTPLLNGCAARFLCRSVHLYDGGDHIIMVGEVVQFERNDTPPLVYHDSGYAIATSTEEQKLTTTGPESATAASLGFLLGSAFFYMYGQLREAGGKLGFTNIELFVLMALGERGWRSRREINSLLAYGGHPTNLQVLDDLEARELLTSRAGISDDPDNTDDTEFDLTPNGQTVFAQFAQAGLTVQQDMENILGTSGTIALRALLRRFVKNTETARAVNWI